MKLGTLLLRNGDRSLAARGSASHQVLYGGRLGTNLVEPGLSISELPSTYLPS